MKKNAMLKIAAILMVAVLLTTCAISSTFAKYTTSAESSATARVAKFGVTVNVGLEDLFKTSYDDTVAGDGTSEVTFSTEKVGDENVITVSDVVAPGTKTDAYATITASGTPEVDVEITYSAKVNLVNWSYTDPETSSTVNYCPLVFTVNGKELKVNGTDLDGDSIDNVSELETAIEAAVAAKTVNVEANTNLATKLQEKDGEAFKNNLEIGWSWAFEGGDDVGDTALGDNAATGTPAAVYIQISAEITQVD